MAVTAKLSRRLYETLGDEAAEAMVGWMESVERNRAELRETSDMAFARIDARFGEMEARFDAKLNQRIGELREEMHAGFGRLERDIMRVEAKIDQRFADLISGRSPSGSAPQSRWPAPSSSSPV